MSTKDATRIVIKLHNNIEVENGEKGLLEYFRKDNPGLWERLMALHSGARVRRLFESFNHEAINALIEKAKTKAQGKGSTYSPPAFNNYYIITCHDDAKAELLRLLVKFNGVERAY